jgi:hypothetical protein
MAMSIELNIEMKKMKMIVRAGFCLAKPDFPIASAKNRRHKVRP